jgi:uncharacterized membrane protein
MAGLFFRRWFRESSKPTPRRRRRPWLYLEPLEERVLLANGAAVAPPAIVLGRTLSSYTTAGVQNNQLSITYTVYNEEASPVSGVLLTDTLQTGVSFQGATQQPDRNGQQLAWSLGTIAGFDRASVTLTVTLPASVPAPVDAGAQAFATLDARAVSAATLAAVLSTRTIAPALLASTPDANTNDPFVQEKAAELAYDPQQIFAYLHTGVGYNSYAGSVRGARGTLWSGAGNALDVASLGVALMRASGIPAQYVQGTLSQTLAQQLILSMFPTSDQQVGFVASGALTTDPANDPQLLAETEAHTWFQFDTGSGFQDADPLLAGATVGQTFTSSTGTFAAVPDSLREKTEVQVVAEITSSAAALFGLGGQADTTVLDQTFNDVELVGRPVTIGFNTSTSSAGFIFTTTTNTYSPYIAWGDDAFDSTHDQIIKGQDFQEVQTNFPFGSSALTGVFLNVVESGPQGSPQTFSRALFDRIGYAARQGLGNGSVSVPPGSAPAFSNFDAYTLDLSAAAPDPHPTAELNQQLQANAAQVAALQGSADEAATATPFARGVNIDLSRGLGNNFLTLSQLHTDALASSAGVAAYYDRPRAVLVSRRLLSDSSGSSFSLSTAIDLLNDSLRVKGEPGQSIAAPYVFNITRGIFENLTERDVVAALAPAGQAPSIDNTYDVFTAAAAQGIGFTDLTSTNLVALDALNIPPDAKARITTDVGNGFGVIVPNQSVMLNGAPTIAWAEMNLATGEYIGVDANGGHQGAFEFLALVGQGLSLQVKVLRFFSPVAGIDAGEFLSVAYELSAAVGDQKAAAAALKVEKQDVEKQFKQLISGASLVANLLELPTASNAKIIDQIISALIGQLRATLPVAQTEFMEALDATVLRLTGQDPEVTGILSNPLPLSTLPSNAASGTVTATSHLTPGSVQGTVQSASVAVSHQISATWSSTAASAFEATALNAAGATVVDASGKTIGTGAVALAAPNAVPIAVSGNDQYSVTGTGSLSFYGAAETTLGVSGNWANYAATVTGNDSIALTTDQLTLNGQTLPAGTYTIATPSATLSGNGPSTSPSFTGSASINATAATVNLGPGSGTLTLGSQALDPTQGSSFTGYTGPLTVASGGGGNTDAVTLQGTAANVLQVSASATALTTDQNTAVQFQAKVQTTLADTYNLTAQAPPGWTVAIDTSGNVTAAPAPGLQSGTYAIQIIAQSATNPDLVAQTTVTVTITATQPGITLTVVPDPQFTVPFHGAQLPSAFQAVLHNTGPSADTFSLTFQSPPAGFTIVSSATQVTIPAGQTGIVGVYLQPSGSLLPAVGTPAPFTVTATSTTTPTVTATQTDAFAVPAVDALTLTTDSAQVSAALGATATVTVTVTNAGNVPETVVPAVAAPAGITASAVFDPVNLPAGMTLTLTVPLHVASTVPVNTTQPVQITVTYGPTAAPLTATTPVSVLVRSAQTVAVSQAATDSAQTGNTGLTTVLSELDDNFMQLLAMPTDAATCGRAQFLFGKLSTLLGADPALASFVAQLQPLQAKASACEGTGLLALVPAFFNSLSSTLAVEATQQFTASLSPTPVDLMPGQSQNFTLQLANSGNDTVALTLSASGLPQGVTANFTQTQVTLQPLATVTVPLALNQTLVSTKVFTLDVTVAASLVQQTATAAVAVRPAAADVLSVTVNPQTVLPGQAVAVGAQVFNTANAKRDVLVHVDVLDSANNVVMSLPNVPATLQPGTDALSLNLGQLPTKTLVNGLYLLSVSLLATDGVRLPGQAAQAPFLLGVPVSATVTASATTLPPGTTTVTTTITVASQLGLAQAAVGDVQVMYNARNTFTTFPDYNKSGTINGEGVSPDGPVFVLENTSGVDITNAALTITPPGGTADSFNVGTVPAGGRVFVEPGVSDDKGTTHTFFKVTGTTLDTSDQGPNADATRFEFTGVQNGNAIDSGVFTPAATAGVSNDGKAPRLNFLGNEDTPCNDCFGPKVVATLFDPHPTAGALTATPSSGSGTPAAAPSGSGTPATSPPGSGTPTTTPSGGSTPTAGPSGSGTPATSPSGGSTSAGKSSGGGSFAPLVAGDSVKWVATTSGNWDVAANWLDTTTNTNHVPDATDEVTIDVAGVTVTVDQGNQATDTLQVAAGSTLAVTSGTLVLNGASEIDGALTVSGGTLVLAGSGLTVKGNTQWSGGNINLDGHTLTNAGTATLTNAVYLVANDSFSGGNHTNLGGMLINTGTVVTQGNGSLGLEDNIAVDNQAAGTFNFANDGSLFVGSASPTVTNEGKIEKTGGTAIASITTAFSSTGTLEVDSGTLSLATGGGTISTAVPLVVASGAKLDLSGNHTGNILSGSFTSTGGGTVLLQDGSVVVGAAGVTFNFPAGAFQWTGGAINLDGHTLTNAGTLTLANGQNPLVLGANDFFTGGNHSNLGGTLANTGTILHQGTGLLYLDDSVVLDNQAAGIYDFAGDGGLAIGSDTPTVTNEGKIAKTGGAAISSITTRFSSTGTLEVDSGTLSLATGGGTISTAVPLVVAAGATLDLTGNQNSTVLSGSFTSSGGGTVLLANGYVNVGAAGATFNFPAGVFQWTGGSINLDGHTLTNTGTLTLANDLNHNDQLFSDDFVTGGNHTNLGGTLVNTGVIVEQGAGPFYLYDSVVLDNQAAGSYTLAGDSSILLASATPAFHNEGTFRKRAGSGTSSITVPFTNTAPTLEVDSGTLSLPVGGSSSGTAFVLGQNSTLDLGNNAGTQSLILNGTFSASGGGTVLFSHGELVVGAAGATFNFPAGVFQWTGGGIDLDGHTLTNAGTLTLANPPNVGIQLYAQGNFDGSNTNNLGGKLANTGAMVQQGGGPLQLYDSVIIDNQAAGSFTFAGDDTIQLGNDSPAFTNEGAFRKSAGSGTASVGVPFRNTAASLEVDSGTLSLPVGGSSTGTAFMVAPNATLDLSNGSATQSLILTGTFTGSGGGTILLGGQGELVVGAAGATFNFPAGMFQGTGGGIDLDGHTLTNIGTLTLALAQSVTFFLYGQGNFDGSNTNNLGGTLANAGAIVQQGTGRLGLYDSVVLDNQAAGTYTFTGDGNLFPGDFSPVLRNEGTVAKTAGSATTTVNVALVNTATVRAASGTLDLSGTVNNGGTIVADGANLTLTGTVTALLSALTNQLTAGTWIARGGATLSFPTNTNVTENRASLTLDGTGSAIAGIANLAINSGTLTVTNGATLALPGALQNNNALAIGPGSTVTVKGNYTQGTTATLDLQLGGAPAVGQFGQLAVTGSAALAGIFQAHVVHGYSPTAGDSFPAITFASSSGSFSPIYLPQTPTVAFQSAVNSTSFVLTAQAATLTPTAVTLTSSAPNGAPWGQTVVFTATVAPTGSGTGTPTGHVQFELDGALVGAPVPLTAGSAQFTTGLTVAQHVVTAFYLSDSATFANSDDAANPLTQVISAGATPALSVQVGYADNLRANPFFPNPWAGSPDTTFIGDTGTFDSGAILIINNSNFPITVNDVTVTLPTGTKLDLWGSNVVPASGNLILAQTNGFNFDTSDFATLSFPNTYPDGETAHAPHVDVTVNSVLLPTFLDTGHILTTGGSDLASNGANESQNWRPIGTTGVSNPGGAVFAVTVTHNLPASGYTVSPTSLTPAPTSSSATQVVWNAQILAGANPTAFQLTGQVTNLAPGEVRQISTGTTVTATTVLSNGQQLTTTIPLAPVVVAGEHIISLTPPAQTVERNAQATYTVELKNPLPTAETYTLSLDGLSGLTTTLAAAVPVAAGQTVDVPLQVSVPVGATVGTQVFDVLARTAEGAMDSVEGQLTVTADVVVSSLAVSLTLTPARAVVGQGAPATYTVAVTNVGDAADTYTLSGAFPAGFTGSFMPATIVVPPGLGNTRDVQLTLTPPAGATAGDDSFSVTATSATSAAVHAMANATATVLGNGVGVTLNPPSGTPGNPFQLTVTNTGQGQDTFDLSLGGPAALVSTLATTKVTLAPGASQVVPISTTAVTFADPGALPLMGFATSETNPAVQSNARANLTITPGTPGLAADLSPATQVLPIPGTSEFLLEVHNTSNTEDSYTATLTGTTGPVTASLVNPETGQPTQTTPVFKVPGLSTGVILLNADLAHTGQGTVTVMVQSQSDPSIVATPTATVIAAAVVVAGSPGTVQFSAPSYTATEEGGAATVTLTRTGGSTGAVSVVLSTADGTATSGQDYTPLSQVVAWADGDASPKTVTIPLNDDNLVEGNDTVRVSLSNPGGGASLGSPASAVLTIQEDQEPAPPRALTPTKVVEHAALTLILTGSGFTKGSVVVMRGHVKGRAFAIRLKTKVLGSTRVQAKVPKSLPSPFGGPTVEENNDLTFSVLTPGGVETASQRFSVLEEVKPGSAGTAAQQAAVVAYEALNSGHEYRLNQIPKSFLKQFFATFGGH